MADSTATPGSIERLPPDVIAQIDSSVVITSLNGVILELIKNSLDACATKLDVTIDYSRGSCMVSDDGLGILPREFDVEGGLGKLHCEQIPLSVHHFLNNTDSSKYRNSLPQHGSRGAFLSSAAALSIVTIVSKHRRHHSTSSITLCQSQVISRNTVNSALSHLPFHHGTKVSIRDLFGTMPVRIKQRAIQASVQTGYKKDWEALRKDVLGLILAWRENVSVVIRTSEPGQKLTIKPKETRAKHDNEPSVALVSRVCNLLYQSSIIYSPERQSWIEVKASLPNVSISGTISLEPAPTKVVQFMSLGVHPLRTEGAGNNNILFEEVNKCFQSSSFGADEPLGKIDKNEMARSKEDRRYKRDGYTNKELRGYGKGVNRWPMFYLRIELKDLRSDKTRLRKNVSIDEQSDIFASVVDLLQSLSVEFLRRHHLQPRNTKRRSQTAYPQQDVSKSKQHFAETTKTKLTGSPEAFPEQVMDKIHQPAGLSCIEERAKVPVLHKEDRSRPASPFDGWTRTKSGKDRNFPNQSATKMVSSATQAIERSSSTPVESQRCQNGLGVHHFPAKSHLLREHVLRSASADAMSNQKPLRLPMISKEGKLTRPPFDSITTEPPESPGVQYSLDHTIMNCGQQDDKVVWTNPVTHERSIVNVTTGFSTSENQASKKSMIYVKRASIPDRDRRQSTGVDDSSIWIQDLMNNWDNPVFQPVEMPIPQVHLEGADAEAQKLLHGHRHHCLQLNVDQAFNSTTGTQSAISKEALKEAHIVSQIDNKFILIKVAANDSSLLVIIDQHAADERCRIESLMEELCAAPSDDDKATKAGTRVRVQSCPLEKPLRFDLSKSEIQLLEDHRQRFADWGVVYRLYQLNRRSDQPKEGQVAVTHMPPGIIERCKVEPRLVVDLLRTEVWKCKENGRLPAQIPTITEENTASEPSWLSKIHNCPQGILDMLNSRACRSSIMFNDELSIEECQALIKKLAECIFPFQCAHGRPSMVPLVNLGSWSVCQDVDPQDDFAKSFSKWKEKTRKCH